MALKDREGKENPTLAKCHSENLFEIKEMSIFDPLFLPSFTHVFPPEREAVSWREDGLGVEMGMGQRSQTGSDIKEKGRAGKESRWATCCTKL